MKELRKEYTIKTIFTTDVIQCRNQVLNIASKLPKQLFVLVMGMPTAITSPQFPIIFRVQDYEVAVPILHVASLKIGFRAPGATMVNSA